MTELVRRRFHGLGHRGVALLFFAVIWVTQGLGVIADPFNRTASHQLPLEYLPIWFRATVWFGAAAAAALACWWPVGKDKWGWVALGIPVSLRVGSYSGGVLMGWIEPRYLFGWLAILGLVTLLSTWPEMPDRVEEE
jgi:hypothetical protein